MAVREEKGFGWLVERPISHRGLHTGNGECPENSLLAFIRSICLGFPVELDVRLLADGKVAVFHDDNTGRMTGTGRPLERLRTRELKRLRLLGTKHRIPLLEDVLETVNGEVPLLIELKTSGKGEWLGEAVMEALEGYSGAFALQSFDPRAVLWVRRHAPAVPRGQLAGSPGEEGVPLWKSLVVERGLLDPLSKPDFFGVAVERLPLRSFENRRRRGARVIGWTVRSVEEEERARRYCDNVIFENYIPSGGAPGGGGTAAGSASAAPDVPRAATSRRRARSRV